MNLSFKLPSHSQRGALMAAALLLMLVSGLFIAGWVTMMGARSIQVSWLEDALQRRIALENSRLLAWQVTMEHAFEPNADLEGKSAMLNGGKAGGLNTDIGWKGMNLYNLLDSPTSMTKVFPYNSTGFRPGASYLDRERFYRPTMSSGVYLDSFTAHQFLKSQSPLLNGDLFVVYRKPDSSLRELNISKSVKPFQVYGRTVIRHPPSLFVRTTSKVDLPFQTKSLYIQSQDEGSRYPIAGTGLDGKTLMPSNLPVIPSSGGPVSTSSGQEFNGYLNVIKNDNNPDNSLWHIMSIGGYNTVAAFDDSLPTTNPYWMAKYYDEPPIPPPDYKNGGYDVPYKTLYINLASLLQRHLRIVNAGGVIDQIVFIGQTSSADFEAAGAMSPIIVTLIQGAGKPVRNIVFQHENNRRLILGVQNVSALSTVAGSFTEREIIFSWAGESILGRELRWRMALINEGHSILLDMHPNAAIDIRWIGGVMTNWSFKRDNDTGPRAERLIFQSDLAVPTLPIVGASYASLLPRDAWLESYFLPVRPQD